MKIPQILPPSDLLEQVEGVEKGLRRGRNLRLLGVLLAAVQVTVLVANSTWLEALLTANWSKVADQWLLFVPLFLLVLSVLLATWTRFWLKESRQPFRYTYSIARFEPAGGEGEQARLRLAGLQPDLRERVSTRIPRLSLLDDQPQPNKADQGAAEDGGTVPHNSHIHVSGFYAQKRRPPDKRWFMEVTVWVRVGNSGRPATLALPVKFPLDDGEDEKAEAPELDESQYEQLLERTYFTVATEIYRQIKQDVGRKIDVLPNRYFRAAAYFHEAEDYARSNTLDAYDEARKLYSRALELYAPGSRRMPDALVRRPFAHTARLFGQLLQWLRHLAAHVVPRLGAAEVLAARAQIGYANTLLYRSLLASLQGRLADPTFETIPVARSATKRLIRLPRDVRGRDASLFDAYVTLALAHAQARSPEASEKLDKARALRPFEADSDPRFLFVSALLENRLLSQLPLFLRASEIDPQFEVAHFQLAMTTEKFWRTRPTLELSIAKAVFRQYGEVLRLNPGNIAAWANRAYVEWLLGQTDEAKRDCLNGRQYKEIKPDTYVAELDHGLARIAAETGDLEEAYLHYINAVSARLAQGKWFGQYSQYHFDLINRKILDRFEAYKLEATKHLAHPSKEEKEATTERMRDSVHAFVLNDYGEACYMYYLRFGDYTALEHAFEALSEAVRLNKRYVIPWWNLYWVQGQRQSALPLAGGSDPGEYLDEVERLEPGWSEAAAEILRRHSERASQARREAVDLDTEARAKRSAAAKARVASNRQDLTSDYRMKTDVDLPLGETPLEAGTNLAYEDPQLLELEADDLERRAKGLRREAVEREGKAQGLPRALLPHKWLWRGDAGCTEEHFNWRALKKRSFKRELRWERSFDYTHVRGLFAWVSDRLREPQPRWAPRHNRLLDLIEERFWPNEFELLAFRHERTEEAPAHDQKGLRRILLPRRRKLALPSYRGRMTEIVEGWLSYDEAAFAWLTWLDPTEPDTYDHFARVARLENLSPYLYRWLGDQLAAERIDDAVAAYLKAMEMDHAGVLFELGQKLENLGQLEKSVQCYKRAKASEDPLTLVPLGEKFMELERYTDALEAYSRARALDGNQQYPTHDEHSYRAKIAQALLNLGEFERAFAELDQIESGGGELGPLWRTGLVQSVGPMRTDEEHALLRSWLEARQRDAVARREGLAAKDAAEALFVLSADNYAGMNRSTGAIASQLDEELLPLTTPIRLEAHRHFFPQDRETPAVDRMIEQDIPAIRHAIQAQTGITVPGFNIQSSDEVSECAYVVLINEIPVRSGIVPAEVTDPHALMLDEVDRAVRSQLDTFLDIQAVEKLLDDWCAVDQQQRRALVDEILMTDQHRRRFTLLLKELARELVPIHDLDAILTACGSEALAEDDLESMVERARYALRPQLPGRNAGSRVDLPTALQERIGQSIQVAGAKRFLALPESELSALRGEFQRLLDHPHNGNTALVVAEADLLPFVHRIVRLDHPQTTVIGRTELDPDPLDLQKRLLGALRR